jgi:hypothetical protein
MTKSHLISSSIYNHFPRVNVSSTVVKHYSTTSVSLTCLERNRFVCETGAGWLNATNLLGRPRCVSSEQTSNRLDTISASSGNNMTGQNHFTADSQPVSQSISQPANQPVSQSTNQSASQPASQSVSQSVNQPASQSASQPASQLVNQSATQPDSQSVRQTASQSVSHSVSLGVEPLRESWPDFDCSQDSWGYFCHEVSSLSRGWVCHVAGHSPCLCKAIYTYVCFDLFLCVCAIYRCPCQHRLCTADYD